VLLCTRILARNSNGTLLFVVPEQV
jgi:hypothetical protein